MPYCFKGHPSNFKVKGQKSLILTRIGRFQTVTLVWIHRWLWNDAHCLMLYRRGALLFFTVIHQISRSQGKKKMLILTQIVRFQTVTPVWIQWWLWNDAQSLKQHRRGALLLFKVFRQISRSHGTKSQQFDPNGAFPDCKSSLNSPVGLKWCTKLDVVQKRCHIVFWGHPSNFKVTRAEKLMIWIQFE